MSCPFCAAGIEKLWRAYVPLWDVDWALRYVLIGEDIAESVDVIERAEQVTISRAKNPISPLIVRHAPGLMRSLPGKEPWSVAIDMEQICLLLWRDNALSQWVAKRGPLASASSSGDAVRSDGKPFSPMLKGAAKKWAAPSDPKPADDAYDAVTRRLKASASKLKPSQNGKHDSSE